MEGNIKILEKRKTSTCRVVIYEHGGTRKSITRPTTTSFEKIVEEIEQLHEGKVFATDKAAIKKEEKPAEKKTTRKRTVKIDE